MSESPRKIRVAVVFGGRSTEHAISCLSAGSVMAALDPAVLAFTAPAQSGRSRMLTLLAALGIAVSGAIGVYHAGVEAKIFEGITTCTALPRGASTADLLKQISRAPLVRCDQVQFTFLGISMAGWNAIISLSGAALIAFLTLRDRAA